MSIPLKAAWSILYLRSVVLEVWFSLQVKKNTMLDFRNVEGSVSGRHGQKKIVNEKP